MKKRFLKKQLLSVFMGLLVFLCQIVPAYAQVTTQTYQNLVYLGVLEYGTQSASNKDALQYRFSANAVEMVFKLADDAVYANHNRLIEGNVYHLTVDNGRITIVTQAEAFGFGSIALLAPDRIQVNTSSIPMTAETKVFNITRQAGGAVVTPDILELGDTVNVYGNPAKIIYKGLPSAPYLAPVKGEPGVHTLKNFLATAMQPVGTALYIYGGGWNWQDTGTAPQASSIGLSQTWMDFFQSQDSSFTYRNAKSQKQSYYPNYGYNQYYFAGLDCSGYVGWAVYNMIHTQSGEEGYVMPSTVMAKSFSKTYHFGTWTQTIKSPYDFKPGDIYSMNGHVWICLGVCDDASLVILHSTPSNSRSGMPGGGVQLSGIGKTENCQAYQLAKKYMETYYPAWSERYPAIFMKYDSYTAFTGRDAGKFSWDLQGTGFSDPEGYSSMSAEKILEDLFAK